MYAIYIEWNGLKADEIAQKIYMAIDIDGVNIILKKFGLLDKNEEYGDGTISVNSHKGYYFQQV